MKGIVNKFAKVLTIIARIPFGGITLDLMVLHTQCRGVITPRIILVIQTMEVHLMKLPY